MISGADGMEDPVTYRFALALALLGGCSEINLIPDEKPSGDQTPGEIRGRVCSADGRSWQGDAVVYTNVFEDDRLVDTVQAYTDLDGRFVLDELPGDATYTVYVQLGDQILSTEQVFLPPGEAVELDEPACFDPRELDVAVITGDYDDFQAVLTGMGFANHEVVDGASLEEITGFLLDAEALARHDVIFVNGGALEEGVLYGEDAGRAEAIAQNLGDYVRAGGQLYVSDWAYDYVERVFPDAIDFVGEDGTPDAAQLGEYGLVEAAVSDASMAEFLGDDHLSIEYDLPVWPPVEDVGDAVSVHLSGTVAYREGTSTFTLPSVPLLVSFSSGEGRVTFSSFRVAKNAGTDLMLVLQYMLFEL